MSELDKPSAPDIVADKKSGGKKPAGAKSAGRGKLSREVKIGLSVIAALAVTFGGVLAFKVRSGMQEADEIAEAKKKAAEGQHDGQLPNTTPSSKMLERMNASTGSPGDEPFNSTASRGAAANDMPPASPYAAAGGAGQPGFAWPPDDGGTGDGASDAASAQTGSASDPFLSAHGFTPPGDGRPIELAPVEPGRLDQPASAVAAADDIPDAHAGATAGDDWAAGDAANSAGPPARDSFSSAITPAAAADTTTAPPAGGYQFYGDEPAAATNNASARTTPAAAAPAEAPYRYDISTPAQRTPQSADAAVSQPGWERQPTGRVPANTASTGDAFAPRAEDRGPDASVAAGRGGESGYTVEPNDNYWSISQMHYQTGAYFKALQRYNRSETSRQEGLHVGDVVAIPPIDVLEEKYPELCPKRSRAMAAGGNTTTVGARGGPGTRVYVVQEGDTVFDIARYELGDARYAKQIVDLNRDALRGDIDYLPRGMELLLPDADSRSNESPVTRRPGDGYPR